MTEVHIKTHSRYLGANAEDDMIDTALRLIATAFGNADEWPEKYGTVFENDIFMMHRFCWCEREDCPWCAGCECPGSAFHYFVDGNEVDSAEHMAFFDRLTGGLEADAKNHEAWMGKANEANRRRTRRHDAVCDYCLGKGIFASYPPGTGAPNFWYKPSNYQLQWYKYIGRDPVANQDWIAGDFLHQIFATHPVGMTLEQAIDQLAKRTEETRASFAAMLSGLGVNIA